MTDKSAELMAAIERLKDTLREIQHLTELKSQGRWKDVVRHSVYEKATAALQEEGLRS